MDVVYLTGAVSAADIGRHVDLLRWGGARVQVAGYRLTDEPRLTLHGAPVTDLGFGSPTWLFERSGLAARGREAARAVAAVTERADVVVARDLQMLLLAARGRQPGTRLVYVRPGVEPAGSVPGLSSLLLRRLERRALRGVDLVVVDTSAGEREMRGSGHAGPVLLLEDKVLALGPADEDWHLPPLLYESSWVIGWFGNLRCRRSWDELQALVRHGAGQIEVLVAGQPGPDVAEAGGFADTPGVRMVGNYIAADLPALRASTHFSWMIDHGGDTGEALPEGLFESVAHCSVPICLTRGAAGDWLARHGSGVLVDEPGIELAALLLGLDAAGYASLVTGIGRIPRQDYLILPDEARAFVEAVAGRG